jgi:hypothetical protein
MVVSIACSPRRRQQKPKEERVKKAFTIIRVSAEDQLRGYGPDVQWFDDVLPNAPLLGLEVEEGLRAVIQESATGWDRDRFEGAVREALRLYQQGVVTALVFPRVDRETRFLFGSLPLLAEAVRLGTEVYFAREKLHLDPEDSDSVERYVSKATQAQAYVETVTMNTSKGRRRRATQDHKMPTGGQKWAFDYDPATGQYRKNEARASWLARCDQWILDEGLSLRKCCRRLEREGVSSPGWEAWLLSIQRGRNWAKRRAPRANKWHPWTLRNILLDDANIGQFYAYKRQTVKGADRKKRLAPADRSQWILVYEDPSQAIRTQERHEALKAVMRRNQEKSPRHAKHWYPPLRSLVFCPLCQRRMIGWHNSSGASYYKCEVCRNLINARRLWEELRESIKAKLLEPDRLVPGIKAQVDSGLALEGLEAERTRLRQQVEDWEEARDKARRLYFVTKGYTQEKYQSDDGRMAGQQERAGQELAEVERRIADVRQAMVDEEGIRAFCQRASQNMENLDDATWRVLLERMRAKVIVPPGEPAIVQLALPTVPDPGEAIASQAWKRACPARRWA